MNVRKQQFVELISSDDFYFSYFEKVDKKKADVLLSNFRQRIRFQREDRFVFAITIVTPFADSRDIYFDKTAREDHAYAVFYQLLHHLQVHANKHYRRSTFRNQRIVDVGCIEHVSRDKEKIVAPHIHALIAVHKNNLSSFRECLQPIPRTNSLQINFDAFNYFENFALFASQVKSFIERDGVIAWGIVPNDAHVNGLEAGELVARFNKGVELLAEKASETGEELSVEQIETHSILTPACGLGSASMEIAEQALELPLATGKALAAN